MQILKLAESGKRNEQAWNACWHFSRLRQRHETSHRYYGVSCDFQPQLCTSFLWPREECTRWCLDFLGNRKTV